MNTVLTVYTVYIRFTVNTVNTVMADLSLKGLDGDLMVKVKVRALDCGMTLREFVTKLLEQAVVDDHANSRNGCELLGAQEETGSPVQSGAVDRGNKRIEAGKERAVEEAVKLWQPVRSGGGTCAHGFPTHPECGFKDGFKVK